MLLTSLLNLACLATFIVLPRGGTTHSGMDFTTSINENSLEIYLQANMRVAVPQFS